MKKLMFILTLVMGTMVFNACTDPVEDVKPDVTVEEVTAPDNDNDDPNTN